MTHPESQRTLDIAEVARETGVGKDSLRAWERRYGFPSPQRNALGERAYTQAEVDRLRSIQRLLLAGLRPGKVVGLPPDALEALLARDPIPAASIDPADPHGEGVESALAALQAQDMAALRRLLSQTLARLGPRSLHHPDGRTVGPADRPGLDGRPAAHL